MWHRLALLVEKLLIFGLLRKLWISRKKYKKENWLLAIFNQLYKEHNLLLIPRNLTLIQFSLIIFILSSQAEWLSHVMVFFSPTNLLFPCVSRPFVLYFLFSRFVVIFVIALKDLPFHFFQINQHTTGFRWLAASIPMVSYLLYYVHTIVIHTTHIMVNHYTMAHTNVLYKEPES